jgi:hypothetical protein
MWRGRVRTRHSPRRPRRVAAWPNGISECWSWWRGNSPLELCRTRIRHGRERQRRETMRIVERWTSANNGQTRQMRTSDIYGNYGLGEILVVHLCVSAEPLDRFMWMYRESLSISWGWSACASDLGPHPLLQVVAFIQCYLRVDSISRTTTCIDMVR